MIDSQVNVFDVNFLVPFQGVRSHSLFTELIAVANDIKPVMRTYAILPEKYHILKNVCFKNGLYMEHSNFRLLDDITIVKDDSEKFFYVYISKDKESCKEAKIVEEKIVMGIKNDYEEHLKFSQLMGYPRCCFDFFFEEMKCLQESHLIEFKAFKNTKSNFSYLLNNLLRGDEYLISHYPCSYDCKESKKYAKKVLESLGILNEKKANDFIKLLKLPVMKFEKVASYVRFIDGKVNKNIVEYSDCWGSEDLCKIFRKGRKIENGKDSIIILNNKIKVGEYRKKSEGDGILFDFK